MSFARGFLAHFCPKQFGVAVVGTQEVVQAGEGNDLLSDSTSAVRMSIRLRAEFEKN